jgi:hypothetical protein
MYSQSSSEHTPLLKSMPQPNHRSNGALDLLSNSIPETSANAGALWAPNPSPKALGWTEHVLPDGSAYFSHERLRVITDVDLRDPRVLDAAMVVLDQKLPDGAGVPEGEEGWECWLRSATGAKKGVFEPVRNWVSHPQRAVMVEKPNGQMTVGDEDRELWHFLYLGHWLIPRSGLDMEYRYWSYMESHPAHVPLPSHAIAEATDALTWAYTGEYRIS